MNKVNLQALQQKQLFLQLLIFSFATVLVWVGASLFLSQQHTGISSELQNLAKPLNPNIHIEVVDQIQQKRSFSPQELQNFAILRLIHNTNGTDTVVTGTQTLPAPEGQATQPGTVPSTVAPIATPEIIPTPAP